MACATIFESTHDSEQALAMFYRSWWFVVLLGLLAINLCVAGLLRFPLSKRQIGFAVTHGSVLVILAGALVTEWLGVRGQVSFFEGDTVEHLDILRDTLTLTRRSDETETTVDLGDLPSGGLRPLERAAVPALALDDVRVEVARYVPDSVASQEVVNDGPLARLAVEVSFSDPHGRSEASAWVFAGQTARLPVGAAPRGGRGRAAPTLGASTGDARAGDRVGGVGTGRVPGLDLRVSRREMHPERGAGGGDRLFAEGAAVHAACPSGRWQSARQRIRPGGQSDHRG